MARTAARQQLYTGLFPVRNGAYPNHSRVRPGTKSIVHHLRGLGHSLQRLSWQYLADLAGGRVE